MLTYVLTALASDIVGIESLCADRPLKSRVKFIKIFFDQCHCFEMWCWRRME